MSSSFVSIRGRVGAMCGLCFICLVSAAGVCSVSLAVVDSKVLIFFFFFNCSQSSQFKGECVCLSSIWPMHGRNQMCRANWHLTYGFKPLVLGKAYGGCSSGVLEWQGEQSRLLVWGMWVLPGGGGCWQLGDPRALSFCVCLAGRIAGDWAQSYLYASAFRKYLPESRVGGI